MQLSADEICCRFMSPLKRNSAEKELTKKFFLILLLALILCGISFDEGYLGFPLRVLLCGSDVEGRKAPHIVCKNIPCLSLLVV